MRVIKFIINYIQYVILGIIFYLCSFRTPAVLDLALDYSVPSYIKNIQSTSLIIITGLMLISIFIESRRRKLQLRKGIDRLFYFYIFNILMIFSVYVNGDFTMDSVVRFVFITLIFLYFGLIVSELDMVNDYQHKVIKSLFWGIFLFVLSNILVMVLGLGNVVWNGRLFGLAGHPNFIGLCGSITIMTGIFLASLKSNTFNKLFYIAAIALGAWVCILSGSRNSLMTSIVFFLSFTFFNLKKPVIKFLLMYSSLLFIFIFLNYFSLQSLDYENRGNTRAETWATLWADASKLPFFGIGRSGVTSNSYLFSIVAGGTIAASFFFTSIIKSFKFFSIKTYNLSSLQSLNFMRSLLLAILFAATFEGFLLDAISASVLSFWLILSFNIKKINSSLTPSL